MQSQTSDTFPSHYENEPISCYDPTFYYTKPFSIDSESNLTSKQGNNLHHKPPEPEPVNLAVETSVKKNTQTPRKRPAKRDKHSKTSVAGSCNPNHTPCLCAYFLSIMFYDSSYIDCFFHIYYPFQFDSFVLEDARIVFYWLIILYFGDR